jgi:DNA-directed RNA polymerase specialized sigma24 family protein
VVSASRGGAARACPVHPFRRAGSRAPRTGALPEEALLGRETLDVVKRAIDELPVAQRRVIATHDIAGLGAVVLHRARSRMRAALEVNFDG